MLKDTSRCEERRFRLLRRVGRWIFPQYRFEWPQIGWWRDEDFNKYLLRFNELDGMNSGRRWMLYQLTRLAKAIPGDTAECGVFEGAGSYLIRRALDGPERTHFVFDSFEGLSAPSAVDGSYWQRGNLSCALERVKANLSDLEGISWQQGWIPNRFAEVRDRTFSFVHIDVDLYEPTLESIQFFYTRVNEGGILVCDDYGFTSCPGATLAVDEFLADKPEKMIALATGGGFLIKGRPTDSPAAL